ncbi:MAG: histidine kinase, partial [Bacteroidota bacterium]
MFKKITSIRWIQHLAFWVLSFYVIGSYFSISSFLKLIDYIYAAFFHIPLLLLVYLNIRFLIPRFFSYAKLYLFVLLNAINLGFAIVLHEFIFEIMIPILPVELYIVSFIDLRILAFIFFIYIVISTLLKLSKSWFLLEQAEKENLSLELSALKSQVNPHFLFNTLNSIYALSLQRSGETPAVVLKLSGLLRYMLYEVSEEMSPLDKEVAVMKDYLDLQKIRLDKSCKINMVVNGAIDVELIPSLLFFPLVENSFKHGLKGASRDSFVHIKLDVSDEQLRFSISNNKGTVDKTESAKYGGIGIQNVKKRLSLLYGDKADLLIKDEASSFTVAINIRK